MEKFIKDVESRDSFLKGISIINVIIAVSFVFANVRFKYIIINVFLLFLIETILRPLNVDFSKNKLNQSDTIKKYILKAILLIIFSISTYIIFWTKNYSLKYTYLLAFLSALILLLYSHYYELKRKYKSRMEEDRGRSKRRILLSFIFPTMVVILFSYSVIKDTFRPEKSLVIENIKTPESISISKERIVDSWNTDDIIDHISEIRNIESEELINGIIEELDSERIENLQGAEILNYENMKSDYSDQYLLTFNYNQVYGSDLKIEKGYIESIRITSEKEVFLEETTFKDSVFGVFKTLEDDYPIDISEDILDQVISYIK